MEDDLKKIYNFQSSLIRDAGEGICTCHNTDEYPFVQFTVWNDQMVDITGYTMEKINRSGWYQTVYPDPELQARAIERMDRMRTGDNLIGEEWEITHSDVGKRIVRFTTSIVESSEETVHVLAILADITERKLAEEELRDSEEKYKTLTETSLTGIFIHQDGRFVFVNENFAKIHGYKLDELIGEHHLKLIHPDEMNAVRELALKRLEGKTVSQRYEVRRIRKDGTTIYSEMLAARIQYKGRPAVMGNVIDITERKKAEEALQETEEKYRLHFENVNDVIQ